MRLPIRQKLVHESQRQVKCPYAMTPEFIVVHNTANDASAMAEVSYMISNIHQVSFHFAVDDKEVVQGLPLDRNAWHAGDGEKGSGNRKGIAIEICYSKSGGIRFQNAEKNAAKLIAKLLHERNWDISKVKKHQDFSGKYCPHRTLEVGWSSFLNMVKAELSVLQDPTPGVSTDTVIYRVNVGSYQSKETAENVKQRLTKEGVTGVWIQAITLKGETWYRVVAGSYTNKANADEVKKKLDSRYNGIWIGLA